MLFLMFIHIIKIQIGMAQYLELEDFKVEVPIFQNFHINFKGLYIAEVIIW